MTDVDVSSVEARPDSVTGIDIRRLRLGCWITLIAIAIARAWFTRYEFDGDSVSYLDMARAISEGHPAAAVNACWSPGYPTLLSFFLWLFHPSPYWECPLVHFVNVLIFAGALISLQLFWSELWLWHKDYAGNQDAEIPETAFWALGYAAFAIANLNMIPVSRVGPDQLMAAFCYLAAWNVLRFRRTLRFSSALMLGLTLGLGYYAKAPLFPLGFVFISCACLGLPRFRKTVSLGLIATVAFLLVSFPLIAALSRGKGRLTFGDAARLNYAFFVDGVQHFQHWQGGPSGSGLPVHPTRKLNSFPEIYEFAETNMGSYPPWFDPTYWYEGVTPHFNWTLQWKVFVANLFLIFQIIVDSATALICAVIILVLLAGYRKQLSKAFQHFWFIWTPGAIGLLMFALVHVVVRYLGGCLILLFAGVVCGCSLPTSDKTRRAVGCIGLAALVTAGTGLISQASQEAFGSNHAAGRSPRNALIADFLLENGLHPDAKVAVIGYGTEAYWAHLARLQVVAEIPAHITSTQAHPALDFWESGPEKQQEALRILEQTGADAVIAGSQLSLEGSVPPWVKPPWKKIAGTDAFVYFFHPVP